jgi:hypothetical protein
LLLRARKERKPLNLRAFSTASHFDLSVETNAKQGRTGNLVLGK